MPDKNKEVPAQTTQDLDVIIKEGLQQFEITPEQPPAAPAANDNPASPAAVPAKEEPAPVSPAAAPEPKPKRFKSHDEAEEGYKNLQADFTRTSQELSTVKKKLTEQETATEREKQTQAAMQDFETYATDRNAQLLDEIDAIDPEEKDYKKKVASAQARRDRDIITAGQKVTAATNITEAPLPPAQPASQAAPSGDDQPAPHNGETVRSYTKQFLADPGKNTGVDPEDILFWSFAQRAPAQDENGNSLSLDNQILWAVEQTKQYHSKIIPPADPQKDITDAAAAAAAANNQHLEMPLGRTASDAPPAQLAGADTQISLSDALDTANNARRL